MPRTSRQILGDYGETVVVRLSCPRCKHASTLRKLPVNFRCADIICDFCGYLAQVKTTERTDVDTLPRALMGSAWGPQKERMDAGIYFPLFISSTRRCSSNVSPYARRPAGPDGWDTGYASTCQKATSQYGWVDPGRQIACVPRGTIAEHYQLGNKRSGQTGPARSQLKACMDSTPSDRESPGPTDPSGTQRARRPLAPEAKSQCRPPVVRRA
jgi:hypothetical protein